MDSSYLVPVAQLMRNVPSTTHLEFSARFDADQRACLAQASAERVLFAVASCAAVDRRIAVVETGAAEGCAATGATAF